VDEAVCAVEDLSSVRHDGRGGRIDFAVERGEIFGLLAQRRRQDHDAARAHDAGSSRPPGEPSSWVTTSAARASACARRSATYRKAISVDAALTGRREPRVLRPRNRSATEPSGERGSTTRSRRWACSPSSVKLARTLSGGMLRRLEMRPPCSTARTCSFSTSRLSASIPRASRRLGEVCACSAPRSARPSPSQLIKWRKQKRVPARGDHGSRSPRRARNARRAARSDRRAESR